ncbi:MAG: VWA domain-containing protein [Pseudomonadales bacterium]|jgi:Ca-activated chloride channel family protein
MYSRQTLLGVALVVLLGCSSTDSGETGERKDTDEVTAASAETPVLTVEPAQNPQNPPAPQPRNEPAEVDHVAGPPRQMANKTVLAESLLIGADASGRAELSRIRMPSEPLDREAYSHFDTNPVHLVSESPVSTFSIDVDTASYANVRRLLGQGVLPRHDAVRVEELVNYFSYDYPTPERADAPFSVYTEMGPSPWHARRHLLHIGIKGYEVPEAELPPANLVFLIDVSGSMQSPDKLGLLKSSMKMLTKRLAPEDSVAIAVYAGAAGTVLEPTPGRDRARILAAIDALTAGGSTNGGAGIRLAYSLAQQGFKADGINRVILATDGDFNVGTTDTEALKNLVEEKRESGVALTVLGFGGGNYNDALMQELAQIGNGNAAYIDTLNEARKVLVEEIGATLNMIAKDVKVQIEFNPEAVAEYRLIGYETRHLDREDFNNDAVDAGDIGAGHTVTALYEIALTGSGGALVDPLRYGPTEHRSARSTADEIAFLKLRYKLPDGETSRLITRAIDRDSIIGELNRTSDNYRFAAAVAGFGQILRGGEYTGSFDLSAAERLASAARGNDAFGYRGEFLGLVRTAEALSGS